VSRALLLFGFGFTGRALARRLGDRWRIHATSRDAGTRAELAQAGLTAHDPADAAQLSEALRRADALLVAAPPTEDGCPALQSLQPLWPRSGPGWIGYLSTTGV
jgi:predicted dinucleotide-binding enzyme